jgi:hypothetical protein
LSRDKLFLRADWANFFRWGEAERSPSLATCAVFIAVGGCTNVAAPHTYGGALATATTSAATALRGRDDLETDRYPQTVLGNEQHQREGLRVNGLWAPWRSRRRTGVRTEHDPEAHPLVVP